MTRYIALIDGEEGGYGVIFPDLPGCTAMGATLDTALANAADALRDWVEVTAENGEAVPSPSALKALREDPDVIEALSTGASLATVPLTLSKAR